MGGLEGHSLTYSEALVAFVKAWEGLKLEASGDPLVPGVRDIGYGHKLAPGEVVGPITEAEAGILLRKDLDERLSELDPHVHVALEQHEQDALLSILYNCGAGAPGEKDGIIWLKSGQPSTLLHRINNNRFEEAADEFPRWCRAEGRIVPGLKRRRLAERAMFLDAEYGSRP